MQAKTRNGQIVDREQKQGMEDAHLFRQETRDVVPLKTSLRSESRSPRKASRTTQQQTPVKPRRQTPASTAAALELPGAHEAASYRMSGVQTRLLQRLKRGRFPPADQLDLHHLTEAAACAMLQDFIADAQGRKLQCVRIIHGKGLRSATGPVLKHMVHRALREHAGVLAFTTCKPAHGGSGAVDVLLRTA
jgi:DNA-nicking Smr family endonuclease